MQTLINYGSVIAFLVFSLGIVLQIIKTNKIKSAGDIAISEVGLRFFASVIILAKIISTNDFYLISGQSVFTATLLYYLVLVVRYRHKRFRLAN